MTSERLEYLDGVRGLGIFLVLVTHALWAFPGFRRPEMNVFGADFWSNPFSIMAAATISIGLASAGHRVVERPAQRWGRRLSAPRPALVAAE